MVFRFMEELILTTEISYFYQRMPERITENVFPIIEILTLVPKFPVYSPSPILPVYYVIVIN